MSGTASALLRDYFYPDLVTVCQSLPNPNFYFPRPLRDLGEGVSLKCDGDEVSLFVATLAYAAQSLQAA
jgi:hypothetical protein